ncbi:MAG: glycosyltransferase [Candidatus Babeliales bacterium]|nr:glycosyltransferase [Candidatus Babeliales bacterium]
MKKISIIIPAYNEEKRIERTLHAYIQFFDGLKQQNLLDYEIVVALNGCKDNTIGVVQEVQKISPQCHYIDLKAAGKGLAIKAGFLDALERSNDLIGFVDADMATSPQAYYDLIAHLDSADGIIASRYMEGSKIYPPRPWIKRWGSKLIYEPLVRLLLGLRYKDLQCGAKIFKREVIEVIAPLMTMTKWAIDAEILYLCKKSGFVIREYPTEWYDQAGSKLSYSSGIRMLGSIITLRLRNSVFRRWFV